MFEKLISLLRKGNCLEDKGERVDIDYSKGEIEYDGLDMYQKSHYRRYQFAKSVISGAGVTGDLACGTGYGTVLLAEKASKVIGVDISEKVIDKIKIRYKDIKNVEFIRHNLLDLKYESFFDNIISFETVEHLREEAVPALFRVFGNALKPGGLLVFSTPYMQQRTKEAVNMGFHLTFCIDEEKIKHWLHENGFLPLSFKYQNYETHDIEDQLEKKDFIICIARRS